MKIKSAWLGTWEGTQEDGKRVVFVLNYRLGEDNVKDFVERLYAVMMYSPREKLMVAKNVKSNPYPVEFDHIQLPEGKSIRYPERMTCGHNPWIYARKVKNLGFVTTGEGEEGELTWEEIPKPNPDGIKF